MHQLLHDLGEEETPLDERRAITQLKADLYGFDADLNHIGGETVESTVRKQFRDRLVALDGVFNELLAHRLTSLKSFGERAGESLRGLGRWLGRHKWGVVGFAALFFGIGSISCALVPLLSLITAPGVALSLTMVIHAIRYAPLAVGLSSTVGGIFLNSLAPGEQNENRNIQWIQNADTISLLNEKIFDMPSENSALDCDNDLNIDD